MVNEYLISFQWSNIEGNQCIEFIEIATTFKNLKTAQNVYKYAFHNNVRYLSVNLAMFLSELYMQLCLKSNKNSQITLKLHCINNFC